MSRIHGKDLVTLTLGGQSLRTDTIHIDYADQSDVHDTTTIGDQAHESTPGLVGGDDIAHELFYDNTNTTGTWAYLTGKLGAASSTLVIADAVRTISVSVLVTKLSLPIPVNDMLKVTATYKKTGATTYS